MRERMCTVRTTKSSHDQASATGPCLTAPRDSVMTALLPRKCVCYIAERARDQVGAAAMSADAHSKKNARRHFI